MTLWTTGTESLSQIFEFASDQYFPTLMKIYKNYTYFHDKLDIKPYGGRRYYIKMKVGGNQTGAAVTERGALPTPKGRKAIEPYATDKFYYGPIDLTGPELHHAESSDIKLNMVTDALVDVGDNLIWTMNCDSMGDGSGRKAQCNGGGSYDGGTGLTTVTFDNGSGLHFNLYESVTFGTDTNAFEIKSINVTGKSFTVGGNAASVALDDAYIYHYGMYASTLDTAVMGLEGHVDSSNPPAGSYQGFSRATAGCECLQAYEKNQASTAFSWIDFNNFFDEIDIRGRELPTDGYMSMGVRNSLQMLMMDMHQNMDPVVSNVGFAEVLSYTYSGKKIEFQVVKDILPGTMYAINRNYMHIIESRPLSWLTDEGNPKLRVKSGFDIFEGSMARYWNIVCTNNQKLGKWVNIKESAIS